MHPYPICNIGPPPLWCSIVIGCPCLYPKAFFVLPMHWLIHVLAIHSAVNALPIPGCLRQLLLASFIKFDPACKCGVADSSWRNGTNHSSPIFSQELSFDWLCVPTPIKIVNQSWSCLQLKQYSSSTCYHQPSWKSSSRPDMHLITCSTKAHGCMLSVLLNRFTSTLLISLWKEMSRPHQWCCFYHPYSCGEVLIWLQNKLSHTVNLRGGCLSDIHSIQLRGNVCR